MSSLTSPLLLVLFVPGLLAAPPRDRHLCPDACPELRETLDKAVEQGLPHLILDGTPVSSDRPTTIGDIAKSVLVLTQFEHKTIS